MASVCSDIEEWAALSALKHWPSLALKAICRWSRTSSTSSCIAPRPDGMRQFYDLDNLWGDAKKVEWQEETKTRTI